MGSSTVSAGVFLVLRLNFDFSLFVSFRFLWLLYLLASWSNFEVVSFTLIEPFGEGGFFLFFGLVSSLGGSSMLLKERLLLSLYLVISLGFSSLDVEGIGSSSWVFLASSSVFIRRNTEDFGENTRNVTLFEILKSLITAVTRAGRS